MFPHRIELKKVLRQDDSESALRNALHVDNLRKGECDDETERYFDALSRDLVTHIAQEEPIHIYLRNMPVDMRNQDVLSGLPGPMVTFASKDCGHAHLLENSLDKLLCLKAGVRLC